MNNDLDQPIGPPLPNWKVPQIPPRLPLNGNYCHLEPLDANAHTIDLYEVFRADVEGGDWTYLPFGPFVHVRTSLDGLRSGRSEMMHPITQSLTY